MGAITFGAGEDLSDRAQGAGRGHERCELRDSVAMSAGRGTPPPECIFHMLTERSHPHSIARYYDTHWFQSYEDEE
ncbi:hypothetical protein ACFCWG_38155 [Streptomyces sp. NPDC056390]|uniref:hypothetical protein n=1 Tax=Streptomyces sp. NPDC056390 TaxID=3345806 RepID=UPI0035DC3422